MIVCIVSALLVYDWLAYVVLAFLRKGSSSRLSSVQVCSYHLLLLSFPRTVCPLGL